MFAYTKRQQIMSDDNCLDATGTDGIVKLIRCHGMKGNQAWDFDSKVVIVLPLIFTVYSFTEDHKIHPSDLFGLKIGWIDTTRQFRTLSIQTGSA